ncbi:enoyl-CoA hydratase/isomerase family protein [Paraneptunicella aestuarii]|uniref:3-hydroxyacyl-CoA dehydrogenase NAD-binding domain-containing protein n=1 Tax=Paraneptunicella aestuarii TaxID=2831148 RepID=UPI001E3747FE|nr:3-hydroxyacyl-CoA dehydrogenase NAD-binding domain-containing protein [Paraneptunicella aestuarii]UAA37706.1 enoyl-CoA hydratase/isomerase family protein [Paraneptunicella aestuarii]
MGQFLYTKDDANIVTITMDMTGPVNALNAEFAELMDDTLAILKAESDLKGVVLASAKNTFFAGGDLNYMVSIEPGQEEDAFNFIERIKAQFRALEILPVPVVAAINGAAMGGGLELCLACNHRVALEKGVVVGLPEVTLGLLPGGGGIVRTVQMLGIQTALPFLLEGKKHKAPEAKALGLIDELAADPDELLAKAKAWITANADDPFAAIQPWDLDKKKHGKAHKIPGGDHNNPANAMFVSGVAAATFKKTRGLLPAPEQIIDMAVEALRLPVDRALTLESRKLAYLVTTPQAKNLIRTFFFQLNDLNNGGSRPAVEQRFKVQKLGVIGAGMMGQGIAYVAAKAGIDVVLKDVSQESADKGKAYSAKLMDKQIQRGRATEQAKEALLGKILATENASDLAGCDLIIEAVFEKMELKHQLTKELESQLADNGVWGSNTSSLPITQLAEASVNPANFVGIHFFSPVDKMPLVELICGKETSAETLAKAFDFTQQIGKTPIVVNDSVGFFTSRTFEAQLNEGAQLVAEGVHPVRVDNLGVAIGMPVGPLTVTDEVSLNLLFQVRDTQIKMGLRDPAKDQTPLGTALREFLCLEQKRGGRQYGGGFFDYNEDGKSIWPELVSQYYREELDISDADIKDRLLFCNVIEALKCFEEGVVNTVADANIGSIMGIGAPAWTGGYLQFVNTYGLANFIERCGELAAKYGARFEAPAIVKRYLAEGKTFS